MDREVDRDRDLPRRLQHPGHVPLGHVRGRRELAREQPFVHTRRVGVTQAVNSVSLSKITSPENAAAYSLGQQIITTAWNCVFALLLVLWVFGWTGGRKLVGESYTGAKEKAAEQSEAHKARKEAKRQERQARRATKHGNEA